MLVLLLGTAIYNGSLVIPGFVGEDLVGKSSMMSSPALNRSPLLTKNAAPGSEFGSKGSPYAPRAQIDVRGDGGGNPSPEVSDVLSWPKERVKEWLQEECGMSSVAAKAFEAKARIDTPVEVDYYRNGGILHTVLRRMASD